MDNKPCISCSKLLNGGVYRKPNMCPHCSALQNPALAADGSPLTAESLQNVRTARPHVKPAAKAVPAKATPQKQTIVAKAKPATELSRFSTPEEAIAARRAALKKSRTVSASKVQEGAAPVSKTTAKTTAKTATRPPAKPTATRPAAKTAIASRPAQAAAKAKSAKPAPTTSVKAKGVNPFLVTTSMRNTQTGDTSSNSSIKRAG